MARIFTVEDDGTAVADTSIRVKGLILGMLVRLDERGVRMVEMTNDE